jgi:Heparinase II/III-like protein/Heparinase II/III N-terminus
MLTGKRGRHNRSGHTRRLAWWLVAIVVIGTILGYGPATTPPTTDARTVAGVSMFADHPEDRPFDRPGREAAARFPVEHAPADAYLPAALRPGCTGGDNAIAEADQLLLNRYRLGAEPAVKLPSNPTWREDPFHDNNWLFNYHALRFVLTLEQAWALTGNRQYLDRALYLLKDWYLDNPRSSPRSTFSWNDHSTAWRAMVLACTAAITVPTWLRTALDLHGRTLASSSFYVRHGNHALNQAIGLLEVGVIRHRADWRGLAADRINHLVVESVTTAGVSREQSVEYAYYNYARYTYARSRLRASGQYVSSAFERIDKMPTFLGWATLPNGEFELIGDTTAKPAPRIAGTLAEFAATGGLAGPRPSAAIRVYGDGYAFGRTGWGDTRAFEDDAAFSLRFGPPVRYHGHVDGGSLNLYAHGRRLIVGTGTYSYNPGPYRAFFVRRRSQNTVDVIGARYSPSGWTSLLFHSRTTSAFAIAVRVRRYESVSDTRTVAFSRRLGYMIVDDRLSSATSRGYVQMWHLFPGSRPVVGGRTVRTTASGGNVVIKQLALAPTITIVKGQTQPVQGWRTFRFNSRVAAPAILARRSGRSARFLTLIAPVPTATTRVRVVSSRYWSDGFSVVVSIGGRTERMTLHGTTISVTSLN